MLNVSPYGLGPVRESDGRVYHGTTQQHSFVTYPGYKPFEGKKNDRMWSKWNYRTETMTSAQEFCRNCTVYQKLTDGAISWRCNGHAKLIGEAYLAEQRKAQREFNELRAQGRDQVVEDLSAGSAGRVSRQAHLGPSSSTSGAARIDGKWIELPHAWEYHTVRWRTTLVDPEAMAVEGKPQVGGLAKRRITQILKPTERVIDDDWTVPHLRSQKLDSEVQSITTFLKANAMDSPTTTVETGAGAVLPTTSWTETGRYRKKQTPPPLVGAGVVPPTPFLNFANPNQNGDEYYVDSKTSELMVPCRGQRDESFGKAESPDKRDFTKDGRRIVWQRNEEGYDVPFVCSGEDVGRGAVDEPVEPLAQGVVSPLSPVITMPTNMTEVPSVLEAGRKPRPESLIRSDEVIYRDAVHLMGPEPMRGILPSLVRKRLVVTVNSNEIIVDENFGKDGPAGDHDWRGKLERTTDIKVYLWYFTVTGEVLVTPGAPKEVFLGCLLYTSPSPRDGLLSRMPSSA